MRRRRNQSPFQAEPEARVRVLKVAATQMRSRVNSLPAALIERPASAVDPARRRNPAAMSWQGDTSGAGGGAGGGYGGGGASSGGAGSAGRDYDTNLV